jgi:2-polyprenyl-3-methyl-5-hydroxy-6-metoxy-1,4-benzoquinol methylase
MNCPICERETTKVRSNAYDDRYGYSGTFDVRRCQHCQHHFLDATFSAHELADLYSTYYPRTFLDVEKVVIPQEGRSTRTWLRGDDASAFRWVPPGVRVLDIGCGFGETLLYHESRGSEAWGIDADANLQRVADRYGLNVKIGLFDADQWPRDFFDYVTLDQVLEHSADPVVMLEGVRRVLKPGGTAIVSTPNGSGAWARIFGRRWINWHVPYHLQHFSKDSLALAARKAGLDIVSTRTLTNSAWMGYQLAHLLSIPKPGNPSPFWVPQRSETKLPLRGRISSRGLERLYVLSFATRFADAFGVGDNLLAVLTRPIAEVPAP